MPTECSLLDHYTNVTSKTSELVLPEARLAEIEGNLKEAKNEEVKWIEQALQLLFKDKLGNNDFLSWAAFHVSIQPDPTDPAALIALLPLIPEKAATLATVKHGMDIQKKITNYLNIQARSL